MVALALTEVVTPQVMGTLVAAMDQAATMTAEAEVAVVATSVAVVIGVAAEVAVAVVATSVAVVISNRPLI